MDTFSGHQNDGYDATGNTPKVNGNETVPKELSVVQTDAKP